MDSADPTIPAASVARRVPPLSHGSGWRRQFRLSTLLIFLTIALLAPLLIFGVYSLNHREQTERSGERERLKTHALDLANAVDRELAGQIATAQMLSSSRSLQSGDFTEFWQHAQDAASQTGGHFVLIDGDHQQLVNTWVEIGVRLPLTNNPAATDAVLQAGEPVVGSLGIGAVAQSSLYAVLVPVFVNGVARYTLAYVPRQNALLDLLQQSYRPEGYRAAIIDANGLIVARSRLHDDFYGQPVAAEVWSLVTGSEGILPTVDLEGNVSLTAYQTSGISDWTVFVWAPETVLQAPAQERRRELLMWAAFAVGTTLVIAWVGGRLIRAPAADLVAAAEELAAGREARFAPTVMQEANAVGAAISAASDTIAEREASLRNSQEQMRAVMRELSHRSLNLLTVVQVMARQASRMARNQADFIESFSARVNGLARSQDLLLMTDWRPVALDALVLSQLSPFVADPELCLEIDGPTVLLRPQAVQYLGMGFHELATNALKYGALSVPEGRVSVRWSVEKDASGAEQLRLRWQEHGGPETKESGHNGFGTVVITSLVPSGLNGEARFNLRKEGLIWELEAPMKNLLEDEKEAPAGTPSASDRV